MLRGPRAGLSAFILLLVGLDLGIKAIAERALVEGRSIEFLVVKLRLVHNPGVAFGVGARLPAPIVVAVTGLITAGLCVYAWCTASTAPVGRRVGLACALAGTAANLIDRAARGRVTDYLHALWGPTFNLADILLVLGAAALTLGLLRPTATGTTKEPSRQVGLS